MSRLVLTHESRQAGSWLIFDVRQKTMDYQALCEVADKEIQLGAYDRVLMDRAMKEADGVKAHAHQIYWRLRAAAIQEEARRFPSGGELYLAEIRARLDSERKSRKLRADVVGWLWVLACFAGLVGAFIFFRAAKSAFHRGSPALYGYAVSGVVCIAVGIVGYIVAKRDAGQDPFADE